MNPINRFLVRWFVCISGLWLSAGFLRGEISYGGNKWALVVGGFVLAVVNTFIKPLVILLSLPAVLLSLGFFLVVINGFMLMLASRLYEPLYVGGFGAALLAGIIIGLVNYLVTTIVEE